MLPFFWSKLRFAGVGERATKRAHKDSTEGKGAFSDEFEDAEFTASVLNNLPTSYDDFESKVIS